MRPSSRPRARVRLASAAALLTAACGDPQRPTPRDLAPDDVASLARPFHVIAHRGASAYAPENTLPAFRRALALGAFEIELDVRLSRDDALVVFHDATLDAKTDRRGLVREYDAAELRRAEIGSWFDRTHPGRPETFAGTTLVTLAETFDALGAAPHYHVEMKGEQENLPRLLLELVERFGLESRVTISSFSRAQLERTRALDARIPICWLLEAGDPLAIDEAARARFDMIGVPASELTRSLVALAHAGGLEIRAWQVADETLMERALCAGSNGMTVDWPDRLIERVVRLVAGDAPLREACAPLR